MAVFFLVDCFGWFIWFYTSSLNISEYYQTLINIPVIAAQLVLLLFALSVFKVHVAIRIFSVTVIVGIAVYYIIFPEFLWLVNVTGLVVMILNIILFAITLTSD